MSSIAFLFLFSRLDLRGVPTRDPSGQRIRLVAGGQAGSHRRSKTRYLEAFGRAVEHSAVLCELGGSGKKDLIRNGDLHSELGFAPLARTTDVIRACDRDPLRSTPAKTLEIMAPGQ